MDNAWLTTILNKTMELHKTRAVFIIFPKLETRFNTHYIKTRKNKRKAFLTP